MLFYGKETETRITDRNGSKIIKETNYVNSQVNLPVRITYSNRVKVFDQKQEMEEYAKFSTDIMNDRGMLDPAFSIERTSLGDEKGFYYIVTTHTRLEYEI